MFSLSLAADQLFVVLFLSLCNPTHMISSMVAAPVRAQGEGEQQGKREREKIRINEYQEREKAIRSNLHQKHDSFLWGFFQYPTADMFALILSRFISWALFR